MYDGITNYQWRQTEPDKLLLSVAEVCEQIGLGPTKVRSLIQSGDIESIRIGKAVRIPVVGLQRFLETRATARREIFK